MYDSIIIYNKYILYILYIHIYII